MSYDVTYRDTVLQVPQPVIGPVLITFVVCDRCGAFVFNPIAHTAYHQEDHGG